MASPFVGLATGAGGAAGLEQLFARQRAEEVLAQQGKKLNLDALGEQHTNDYRNRDLGEKTREFDENAPVRGANINESNANAGHLGAETGVLNNQISLLKGFMGNNGDQASVPGNNPAGRLRLAAAKIDPNNIFGAVDTSNTSEEQWLDKFAQSIGKNSRQDLNVDETIAGLKKHPKYQQAQTRIDISGQGMDLRKQESELRQRKSNLDIKEAEARLAQVPPMQREMALAEFRNRVQNDVKSKQTWSQWFNGDPVEDPSAQISAIAEDVNKKYGAHPSAPATVDDLDKILMQRRQGRGATPPR